MEVGACMQGSKWHLHLPLVSQLTTMILGMTEHFERSTSCKVQKNEVEEGIE